MNNGLGYRQAQQRKKSGMLAILTVRSKADKRLGYTLVERGQPQKRLSWHFRPARE